MVRGGAELGPGGKGGRRGRGNLGGHVGGATVLGGSREGRTSCSLSSAAELLFCRAEKDSSQRVLPFDSTPFKPKCSKITQHCCADDGHGGRLHLQATCIVTIDSTAQSVSLNTLHITHCSLHYTLSVSYVLVYIV